MNSEKIQLLDKTTHHVYHALGNMLTSTRIVIEEFDTLPFEFKVEIEQSWKAVYLQAIQDLQAMLGYYDES